MTSAGEWLANDDLFLRELQKGHRWAQHVAVRLEEAGVAAEVSPLTVRDHVDDRDDYNDEQDITVFRPVRVEVKSRNLMFTCPEDYPYATAYVYSVRGWQAKTRKPAAVLLVSQLTGAIVAVPGSSEPRWTVCHPYDSERGFDYDVYEVGRAELVPFERFTEWVLR